MTAQVEVKVRLSSAQYIMSFPMAAAQEPDSATPVHKVVLQQARRVSRVIAPSSSVLAPGLHAIVG